MRRTGEEYNSMRCSLRKKDRRRETDRLAGQLRRRIAQSGGFSLTELLTSVMILMLASMIVASGVPVARNAIRKVTDSANAEMLLSSVTTIMRDEVSMATSVEIQNGGVAVSDGTAGTAIVYKNDMTGERILTGGVIPEGSGTKTVAEALQVSTGMTEKGKYVVRFTDVKKQGEVITFTGLSVVRKEDDLVLAKTDTYQIRMLNVK